MKRPLAFLLAAACIAGIAIAGTVSPSPAAERLKIVAGTEMIADIVRDLTGDAEILVLVPAASCPGHHDVRAADIAFITGADAVILHSWQEKQKHITDALNAAGFRPQNVTKEASLSDTGMGKAANSRSRSGAREASLPDASIVRYILPPASWLVPENQMQGINEVLAALPRGSAGDFGKRMAAANKRLMRVARLADEYAAKFEPYKDTPVMASAMQADFVKHLGLNVVAVFGRAEDMPPGDLVRLAQEGKKAGVKLVADNLQSGSEAGKPLSAELGAAHVVLSNFPMFMPEVPTYEALYKYNCDLILAALRNTAR